MSDFSPTDALCSTVQAALQLSKAKDLQLQFKGHENDHEARRVCFWRSTSPSACRRSGSNGISQSGLSANQTVRHPSLKAKPERMDFATSHGIQITVQSGVRSRVISHGCALIFKRYSIFANTKSVWHMWENCYRCKDCFETNTLRMQFVDHEHGVARLKVHRGQCINTEQSGQKNPSVLLSLGI